MEHPLPPAQTPPTEGDAADRRLLIALRASLAVAAVAAVTGLLLMATLMEASADHGAQDRRHRVVAPPASPGT
jgi:hypothetical protein